MQGIGGIMSIQGEPDGEPIKVAVAIADLVAGLYAATGVLSALVERAVTGAGRTLEVALIDAQVSWLANRAGDWLIAGIEPQRLGNAHPSIVPYETFHAPTGTSTWRRAPTTTSAGSASRRAATTWPPIPATARTAAGSSTARSWCPSCSG